MSATIIAFKPKPPAEAAEAAPPRRRHATSELWNELLGMTSRQSEMAFDLCFRNRARSKLTRAALCRYFVASERFEKALEDYREELLKNLDAYCPRAANRIREGKPPRRRRKQSA
jgi:hypothetical protein